MRSQAWERAKGELASMLWTFHSPHDSITGQFEKLDTRIDAFFKSVESEGLHE
jgi:hypothetical protein